jgi:hypothetical protein
MLEPDYFAKMTNAAFAARKFSVGDEKKQATILSKSPFTIC